MTPTDASAPVELEPTASVSSAASESAGNSETTIAAIKSDDVREVETPSVLKQPEGRTRFWAAIGGIVLGVGVALLCFFATSHESIVGRMFDFRKAEVVVPICIVTVFFWGLLLCWHRWRRVQACEGVSGSKLLTTATLTLTAKGIHALSRQLDHPEAEFHPLLRRLKALVSQWQLKPGFVEADLALQQFVADDEESTRQAYSVIRTFVWALPVLGLIGTVLGIAFAVGGFANFLGGRVDDVEAIKTSLVGVTGGLSFAFLLTLLGLATSLVLMLVASSLETREERLYQGIQQRIVGSFLPVLQRASPAEEVGDSKVDPIVDLLKAAANAILAHMANLARTHITQLSEALRTQQQEISAWGKGMQDQAASAAAVMKSSLEGAAKHLHESGGEFLAQLDLVRQTWKEQTDAAQTALRNQEQTNKALITHLQTAVNQQAQSTQSLAALLQSMQAALSGSTTVVQSLDAALCRFADSPLERTASLLAKSLEDVSTESKIITHTLAAVTTSAGKTAELQAHVHNAVKQLHDLKLVETLASFRDSLGRHANLVDKLNTGLTIRLSQ